MPIGTVLLIFDLVEGRGAALFVAGMTLLAVIILASLPRFRGLAAPRIRQTSEQDQLKETIMPGKKKPGHSVKDAKVYKKIQEQGGSKEKASQVANASALRGRSSVGKSSSYDDWKSMTCASAPRHSVSAGIPARTSQSWYRCCAVTD
jgi:hypothetical protein